MLGAMRANFGPMGQAIFGHGGIARGGLGPGAAVRKRLTRPWGLLALLLPLLGACAPLTTSPSEPGPASPAIPAPFENYDPVRPPAYKRAPQPRPTPASGERRKEAEPAFRGILRPAPPATPEGRAQRDTKVE
ncbi:hypothetical protein D3C86_287480 [compost metagenome]